MKHILITGASSGLGAALALHYAAHNVLLSLCARHEKRLDDIAQQCRDFGAQVDTIIIDVTDKQAMEKWITNRDHQRPIDLLIANAGISGTSSDLKSAEDVFAVNIGGVVNSVHPILPKMIARNRGQIALMASLAGYRGLPSAPAYSASKCFVKAYGEALRGCHARDQVNINVICPGFVRSRITDQNNFSMPGFMEADIAAAHIAKGLEKNKPVIAFPWFMVFGVWILSLLPGRVFQLLAKRLPAKA